MPVLTLLKSQCFIFEGEGLDGGGIYINPSSSLRKVIFVGA